MKNCVVIVAHPDDETLWAGGTILLHPTWHWLVVCLCRKSDEDRANKFKRAMSQFNADSVIGDMNDGPDQRPLSSEEVEQTIVKLLPSTSFDLIVTHDPQGEYTRHLRHEETSRAVINLWGSGKIMTKELWLFAYEDNNRKYYPKPIKMANIFRPLSRKVWTEKYNIITKTYGFDPQSWEAQTTPRAEAFWRFKSSFDARISVLNKTTQL